jgi:hypothetical protein
MVVLMVLTELPAANTGSCVGSPIAFRAIFGKFSWRRKMDDHFSVWWRRKSYIFG